VNDIEVLWLDDDSPKKVEGIKGIKVVTAQTCGEAERLLTSGLVRPRWAVVDLIVPQGGWGDSVTAIPGLHYIGHLKRKYGDKLGIVAFSIVMPDRMRDKVIAAGAIDGIAKPTKSWASLLEDLQKISCIETQRGGDEAESKKK
jgi:hypothetical protein